MDEIDLCPNCYHPMRIHSEGEAPGGELEYRCWQAEYAERCNCKYQRPQDTWQDAFGAKLKQVKVAICHKNCADGTTSALFIKDALPWVEIRFVQYGTKEREELKPEPGMLFCDFSPSESNFKDFVDAGTLILDHHKFAEDVVKAFGDNGVFGDEKTEPGVCGAYLAYREVWLRFRPDATAAEKATAERIARLAGIRDTWQRQSPDWETACELAETMSFYPSDSWLEKNQPFADATWWEDRLKIGQLRRASMARSVDRAVEGAYKFTTSEGTGTRVMMFPNTRLSSDTSDRAGTSTDLVVGFDFGATEDGMATLIFSTRTKTGFNCGGFCKAFGGGGHTAAAGFSVKFPIDRGGSDPYTVFKRLLAAYERGEIHYDAITVQPASGDFLVLGGWGIDNLTPRLSTQNLEAARRYPSKNRVRVGVESLGVDEKGDSNYPDAIEVWV